MASCIFFPVLLLSQLMFALISGCTADAAVALNHLMQRFLWGAFISLTTMRTSTIIATLITTIIAVHAAPLDPAVIPRSTIHDLNSFRAASHADQQAFLLALDPKTWTLSDADLAKITKQPKVAKLLNGRVLMMQDMRNWLVYFGEKHGKTKQD
ncbi:hypothetical protein C8F04DRAFT_1191644 [Mycena alexandri]|uniref:RxLR effector protein n=1 Tax=Mycena alexandri TaxID=1745969 RepID=A0AAD6RZV0_9AGAR|nr:hypothetical protein C8F04DRAFT_1199021 [Mycena alexandri]KAJ7025297.1 hypothetical protein C8F04DRAFT_1191644 [Mycena alexandri]